MSNCLQPHGLQHVRLPCPSSTPGAGSNSGPLSLWCHPTISSSVIPLSSYLKSFPASGSFPMSQFFIKASISSVWLPSYVQLFETPWTAACQASRPITNSRSLLKFMSIQSVMPYSHLILCCSLLLLPSIFPSISVFTNESALHIRWPKYWNFSIERLLLNKKTPGFLASRGEEFNLGPETRLDRSELLCNKVLLKYKGDRESFLYRHQKEAERVPPC